MKILVTGAGGYLGSGIVEHILDRGHQVVAADWNVSRVDSRACAVACDLFSVEDPYNYFGQPDAVLHLAWRDGFVHYSSAHIDDLPLHYHFLEKLMDAGIKKVAVMGSMHEIGFIEGSIKEDTPCHPITPYGISKNALRNLTQMLCTQKNVQFQWLRGYYIVGNTTAGNSVFSKLAAAAAEGKAEFPFTMGQNQYDFVDYEAFCEQVAAAVSQNQVLGIINICSGRPQTLAARVERFIEENGYTIKLKYGAFPDRPYDSKAVWGDDSKIRQILENETH